MDMDALISERVGQGILQVAELQERALDAKIKEMENMDEDDFEALRQKRKQDMLKQRQQEQTWRQNGHGRYAEVTDTKEFFNVCKKSSRVVAHFYRGVTALCEVVDSHFERLAMTHLETLFLKVNVEKNPFLAERLNIIVIPTIVLIKDGKTEHSIIGFDELGGTTEFSTEDMAFVLSKYKVLNFSADRSEAIEERKKGAGVNSIKLSSIRSGLVRDDMEDDF